MTLYDKWRATTPEEREEAQKMPPTARLATQAEINAMGPIGMFFPVSKKKPPKTSSEEKEPGQKSLD